MMNIISPYDDHHTKEGKGNGEREQSFQLSDFPSLFSWDEHSTFSLAIIMMMVLKHPRVGDDWDHGVCDRWNSSEFWWAIGKPHKSLRVKISHVYCIFGYLDSILGEYMGWIFSLAALSPYLHPSRSDTSPLQGNIWQKKYLPSKKQDFSKCRFFFFSLSYFRAQQGSMVSSSAKDHG